MTNETMQLKGEGQTKVTISYRTRKECDNCGNPATKRITYCYVNGRRNPASSMYGQDDCTYCADSEAYACEECESDVRRSCQPEGMSWTSTFTLRLGVNDSMFLQWNDRNATPEEINALTGV